jgi:hypothetical protein
MAPISGRRRISGGNGADSGTPWIAEAPLLPRLTSDFWVSAYLRQAASDGFVAVLRRRGAREAGAVFVKLDRLDGTAALYGPAPQALADEAGERRFQLLLDADPLTVEDRVTRELRFDSDLWLVEIENRAGDARLELVEG